MQEESIGVFIPTFQRPDLLRACVLQMLVQTRKPDAICVHQNGSAESYEWCIDDLKPLAAIEWLLSPEQLPQALWYALPLKRLLDQGCTRFFWVDHDDLYRRDHIERCLVELKDIDFTVSNQCAVLYVVHNEYRFVPLSHFEVHGPGGMSASMAFNRVFAQALYDDFLAHLDTQYADNILSLVTLPRFRKRVSDRQTTVYVSHLGSATSAGWLDGAFKPAEPPTQAP